MISYFYGKEWHSSPDCHSSFQIGPFSSKDEGEAEFARVLVRMGYSEPRWWQYWRWGEHRLSPSVAAWFRQIKETAQ